jgi:hypothetical protein
MKASAKYMLCITLALFTLLSGFPLRHRQDADHSGKVDLRDAVLHVKQLVGTADEAGSFQAEAALVIQTMQVAAGMKTVIRQHTPVKDTSFTSGADSVFICQSAGFELMTEYIEPVVQLQNTLESILLAPPSPPPRIS